jgi:NAD(P)-dependent dehydrogenase (short-subunit alcohol dehydrogenase family)
MDKKVVIVFGGSGGIGKAICSHLAKEMIVYGSFCHHRAQLPGVEFRSCDVSNQENVKALMEDVYKVHQRIDGVINAVTNPLNLKPFEKLSSDDFMESWRINGLGGIHIIKSAFEYMKTSPAVIITLLSKVVQGIPPVRMSSYVTSKYALKGFIDCVRVENRNNNLKIFTISPSFVETDLISVFPPKLLEIERQKQAEGVFIQPDDLGFLVAKMIKIPDSFEASDIVINTRDDISKYM